MTDMRITIEFNQSLACWVWQVYVNGDLVDRGHHKSLEKACEWAQGALGGRLEEFGLEELGPFA